MSPSEVPTVSTVPLSRSSNRGGSVKLHTVPRQPFAVLTVSVKRTRPPLTV